MTMFSPGPLWATPTDPNVQPRNVARLTGQNAAILARLRQGPATNRELAGYSLKYTSRISDLRAHLGTRGTIAECNGVYTLKESP